MSVAAQLNGKSQVHQPRLYSGISSSLRYEGRFFFGNGQRGHGNPVTLLVVVSPGVKFHSEECCLGWQTFPSLWRCSAALARPAGAQSVSAASVSRPPLCKPRLIVRQTNKPELV